MERAQLIDYMLHPKTSDEELTANLEKTLEMYPYFQPAHLLLLKRLKQSDEQLFAAQLKKSALHITDRRNLFEYLNNIEEAQLHRKLELLTEQREQFFEMIENGEEKTTEATELMELEIDTTGYRLESPEEEMEISLPASQINRKVQGQNNEEPQDEHNKLIETFLESSPEFAPRTSLDGEKRDLSTESVTHRDDMITETLANIYIRQKHYQKAIDAFEKLSLKFPEKNSYFAGRIEEIKKLMTK